MRDHVEVINGSIKKTGFRHVAHPVINKSLSTREDEKQLDNLHWTEIKQSLVIFTLNHK